MKKRKKYFGFLIVPLIKIILSIPKLRNTKYGKIRVSIFKKGSWTEKQKEAFDASIALLENSISTNSVSQVYRNINRIYLGPSIARSTDYILIPCKMLIIFYKEGYTDNYRYLASLLVRCACEMENFDLPKEERMRVGRIAQLDCLSNFSGEDIDFFKERLTNLINTESDSPPPKILKDDND